MEMSRTPQGAVAALGRSPFRRKFKLSVDDRAYLREHGLADVLAHARALVLERLSPAAPENEGRQTPFRGHPVLVAQHGTATCCRRCLHKWHHIPAGRPLGAAEENYIVAVIECWLRTQSRPQSAAPGLPAAAA